MKGTAKSKKKSRMGGIWRRLKKNKAAVVSLYVIIIVILVAVFASVIAPYKYDAQDFSSSYAGPSKDHLLGCDKLGRDIFSRIIYGAQQSLQLGIIAVAISAVVGILIGAIAGYYGGWTDNLIMRGLDIYQSIPMFLLCVTLAAVMGPSLRNAIIAIGISMMPSPARLMRASILTVRGQEYIEAAKLINARNPRIIMEAYHPECDCADDCRDYDEHRELHPGRSGAQLYRAWRAAADTGMGRDDLGREKCYAGARHARAVSRDLRHAHRPRIQPVRRRAAGRA